jgi:hypothetical protein
MQDGWRNMGYASFRPRAAKPVSWLLAASQRPAVNLVLSPIFWILSFTFSVFLRTAFITLPICLFWYIYNYCWDYYFLHFPPDSGLFVPAWPVPRTRLVMLMATIPAWGLSMAVVVVVWHLIKYLGGHVFGRKRRGDYELAMPMEEVRSNTPRKSTPAGHRSYMVFSWRNLSIVSFAIFVVMALSGVYLFETYELPADHRYKPDVETALRVPKESGYHNGSKQNCVECVFSLIKYRAAKVFIAAMFNNNIEILPYWIKEFTKVIYYLGVVSNHFLIASRLSI